MLKKKKEHIIIIMNKMSPKMLGLVSGGIALLIVGVAVWFILGTDNVQSKICGSSSGWLNKECDSSGQVTNGYKAAWSVGLGAIIGIIVGLIAFYAVKKKGLYRSPLA